MIIQSTKSQGKLQILRKKTVSGLTYLACVIVLHGVKKKHFSFKLSNKGEVS